MLTTRQLKSTILNILETYVAQGKKYSIHKDRIRDCSYHIYQSKNYLGTVYSDATGMHAEIRTRGNAKGCKCATVAKAIEWVLDNTSNDKSGCYEFYQPNPTEGSKCTKGDCAIRSLSKALNADWRSTMRILCDWAIEHYTLPNSLDDTLKPYLLENGYVFQGLKERPTAAKFAAEHTEGTFLLYAQVGYGTHMMTLVDGKVYDAWDSTSYHLYGFFKKD